MSELTVLLRQFLRKTYKLIPGEPMKSQLLSLDSWFRNRNATKQVIVDRGGITYKLDLEQMIDNILYYNGFFEPEMIHAFANFLEPGMTVFDIGANVGAHTFRMAKTVKSAGRVFAFEPTQWAFSKLKENAELNPDINNIKFVNIALSDQDVESGQYAFKSQWIEGDETKKEEGMVDYLTLDTYCEKKHISQVDFIKLDVDGYETKILRGARKTLKACRPILIVEMSDYWQQTVGDSIDELIGILNEFGYDYYDDKAFMPIEDPVALVKALKGEEAINIVCLPLLGQKK